MSLLPGWCMAAEGIARCAAVIDPEMGDRMFGGLLGLTDGSVRDPDLSRPGGTWFRAGEGERGFVFIGPVGGDHHFQAAPPPGIDPARLPVLPPAPTGRLWQELDAFLHDAKRLDAGEAIAVQGQAEPVQGDAADMPVIRHVLQMLQNARALRDPARARTIMREVAGGFLEALPLGAAGALQAATGQVARLRDRCGADARIWTTALIRAGVGVKLLQGGPAPKVLFKMFDPTGALSDPDEALRQTVRDFAGAGHAALVIEVCDATLAQAEAARDGALAAQSARDHQLALFAAVGYAFTVMRTAEIMRDQVPAALWPADLTAELLHGYAANAEEIVVRGGQALTTSCINMGSGASFRRHAALVAAAGPAKADELIEDYWFYPRTMRDLLLKPTQPGQPA